MTWTQPICAACWMAEHPGRSPVRVRDTIERCCMCGGDTAAGIYVRRDPATVSYPAEDDVSYPAEDDDE